MVRVVARHEARLDENATDSMLACERSQGYACFERELTVDSCDGHANHHLSGDKFHFAAAQRRWKQIEFFDGEKLFRDWCCHAHRVPDPACGPLPVGEQSGTLAACSCG